MTNNVFITGGSRGIGAAAVLAFARAGYNVAFTYNSHPDAADSVRRQAEEINPGGLYLAIRADAGDPAQVRAAVARAEQELGSLQVLVCNAGIAQVKLFTDTTDEDWRRMMAVDLDGAFYACRAVLPGMIHRKYGRILLVSSMWAPGRPTGRVQWLQPQALPPVPAFFHAQALFSALSAWQRLL